MFPLVLGIWTFQPSPKTHKLRVLLCDAAGIFLENDVMLRKAYELCMYIRRRSDVLFLHT